MKLRYCLAVAAVIVSVIVKSGFSFVPLADQQNTLGSYRASATHGLFYTELDILSVYPVELLDFSGNNLYTSWSNARNSWNSDVIYPTALSWTANTGDTNLSRLTLGAAGDPLSMFGVRNSRAGFVFQNYGGVTNSINLDGVAGADSMFSNESVANIATSVTDVTPIRTETASTDVKFYTDTVSTNWNAGIAKQGLFLRNLDLGAGILNFTNSNKLISGGTKSYTDRYLSDAGAALNLMPAGAREGDTYSADYIKDSVEQNSMYRTDLLFQGRYKMGKALNVTGGLGLTMQTQINPGGLLNAGGVVQAASLEKNAVQITAKDDKAYTGVQYYNTGTSIKNRGVFDYATNPSLAAFGSAVAGVWDANTANAGTTDFKDTRTGMGPVVNLQAVLDAGKVDLTGIVYFDNVSRVIDSKQTMREYVRTVTVNPLVPTETRTWVESDYTADIKSEGENSERNIDYGAKIEFKTLENIKLALGGFIRNNLVINNFSKVTANITQNISYDDGNAANITGVTTGLKPGAADGFGVTTGNGEGTWSETTSREFGAKVETFTQRYFIPVAMEIPVYKDKWIFRAGTSYTLTKTQVITRSVTKSSKTSTTAVPAGGASASVEAIDNDPDMTETTTNAETHTTSYTYGIQWNVNKSLTVAANAFLDTNSNLGTDKATIFDLDTFRLLSLQAVFHF